MSADRWDLLPPELAVDEEPFDVAALTHYEQLPESLRAWTITDAGSADWAMRHLAQAEAELAALAERATVWAVKIEAWFDTASSNPRRSADFFRAHLEAYALAQREESGGKVKTITLPSGKIATRPGSGPKVRVGDPEAFKAWALANPDHPAVRIKAELDAREAQARLAIVPNMDSSIDAEGNITLGGPPVVVDQTGEELEWARVEPPSPPSATVTPS